ncbi:deoxynucleoside kinase [Ureaplasma parvum]|uniref:Deoxyguanosine kinase n=3 Tax=Ureaplasma parvum TaxID=134821 RepID=Q9PR59_UREPA|nr:deoxynucleoside kinase [Ureaplasma parvum]pir/E82935/ deoxyguanosine kinase UU086 [imported] - Ureaplasma urealyticum [Ureaplasma urealyticum]AAF30491.1 deoxyguanosine kinase [Ureaplasma parvum serovar 3 str. ATCC 700970]ACA33104.1 deoxyguanosine kinase [Ureaplasma parvum serovar 3 str. ATCC 27815]ASD24557.1 deoxynucleoside kinase [Ureaplasma parvum]ASD25164.1 deoxynucleoside kinase [Ureaplasma parvum]ASD28904.1 deoxynucleoside kinase [Ureaplasma parvum]
MSDKKLDFLTPSFKKNRVSNSIAIGGMIAFGKSTLAQALHEKYQPSNVVYEMVEGDKLMDLLLAKMYERENNVLFGSLFQLYFVLNRFANYKNNCNRKSLTIFDRSIFEDWLFAHANIDKPSVFSYYDGLWQGVCKELIYEHGVPKLYVILDGDWELFKERIFKRNRKVEIDNFSINETYFKRLLEMYKNYMVNVCKDFGINYVVLDANNSVEQNVDEVTKILQKLENEQDK